MTLHLAPSLLSLSVEMNIVNLNSPTRKKDFTSLLFIIMQMFTRYCILETCLRTKVNGALKISQNPERNPPSKRNNITSNKKRGTLSTLDDEMTSTRRLRGRVHRRRHPQRRRSSLLTPSSIPTVRGPKALCFFPGSTAQT